MKLNSRLIATVGLSLTMLVAGCAAPADEGKTAKGPKDLVVGLLVPLTGSLGSYGADWKRAYELAAKEINDSKLLPNGGQIVLKVENEAGDPEGAIRAGTKMIQTGKVQAILGPTSDTIVALNQLAKSKEIPVISPAAGTVRLDNLAGEWLYRTYPSDSEEGVALASYLSQEGIKTASTLTESAEGPEGIIKVFSSSFAGKGGTVLNAVSVNPGQASYAAEIRKAMTKNPELIYVAAGEEAGRSLLRGLRSAGFAGRIAVNADLSSPEFMKSVGSDTLKGVCVAQATPDETLPAAKRFEQIWEAATSDKPYVTLSNAYDSMMLVALAAIKAGSNTGAAIRSGLSEISNPPGELVETFEAGATALNEGREINYNGASGTLDFDDHGTTPAPFKVYCADAGEWAQESDVK